MILWRYNGEWSGPMNVNEGYRIPHGIFCCVGMIFLGSSWLTLKKMWVQYIYSDSHPMMCLPRANLSSSDCSYTSNYRTIGSSRWIFLVNSSIWGPNLRQFSWRRTTPSIPSLVRFFGIPMDGMREWSSRNQVPGTRYSPVLTTNEKWYV
jgi:hypothetical protein